MWSRQCVAAHLPLSLKEHAEELRMVSERRLAAERAARPSSEHDEPLQAAQQAELEALAQLNSATQSFKVCRLRLRRGRAGMLQWW